MLRGLQYPNYIYKLFEIVYQDDPSALVDPNLVEPASPRCCHRGLEVTASSGLPAVASP